MRVVEVVVAAGWTAFWIYWLASAVSVKKGHVPWSRELRIRLVIVAAVVVAIRLGAFRGQSLNTSPGRSAVGLILFFAGLTLAIWARVHLGRNWGAPMTEKEDPELVTSGPYALVRHPIYAGILLAIVGSSVALDWQWLVVAVLAAIYFIYSANVEERFLAEQMPETYPAYRRSTKMLVPFVF